MPTAQPAVEGVRPSVSGDIAPAPHGLAAARELPVSASPGEVNPRPQGLLSKQEGGRLGGVVLVAGGIAVLLALLLPRPQGVEPTLLGVVGTLAIAAGGVACWWPWDRFPSWASLSLVLPACALIDLESFGASPTHPYGYSVFFMLVFVWIGIAFRRWTSTKLAPVVAAAWLLPMLPLHAPLAPTLVSGSLAVAACVLVGEALSWVGQRLTTRTREVLEGSERRYRDLVERSPDGILVVVEGRLAFANPAAVSLLGAASPADLLGRPVLDFIHPGSHDLARGRIAAQIAGQEMPLVAYKFVRVDGREIDVEVKGIPTTFDGQPAAQGVFRDITERRRAERALREAEARYRTLVEQVPAAVYVADFDEAGRWRYVSPQIESILGYSPEELIEDPSLFDRAIHPEDEPRYRAAEAKSRRSGEPLFVHYRMTHKNGRAVWVRDVARVVGGLSQATAMQGLLLDVTELHEAEEELRESHERLAAASDARVTLLSRLVTAQEEERRRIAVDIHDDPLQKLSAVAMRLDMLGTHNPEIAKSEGLAKLRAVLDDTIGSLRHLMFDLRPYTLDSQGLGQTLRLHLQSRFAGEGAPSWELEGAFATEPPETARVILYRGTQEILANVAKHAHASNVQVTLAEGNGRYLVRVADDGIGFAAEEPLRSRKGHLGLPALRERVGVAGGGLRIDGAPGKGTTVEFWLPVAGQETAR